MVVCFFINIHCCSIFRTQENTAKEICLELGADGYVIVLSSYGYFFSPPVWESSALHKWVFLLLQRAKFCCAERLSLWTSYKARGGLIWEVFEFNSFQIWPCIWWPEALFGRNNSDSCYILVFHTAAISHVRCSKTTICCIVD